MKDQPIGKLLLARVTAAKVEERLREMERDGLGPNSLNHLRRVLLGIFRRATKAGLWYGPNPIDAVETRREHERAYETLKPREVAMFFKNTPDQRRDVFATALYLGLRRGELFALKKTDIDLTSMIATIRSSYTRQTTKGGHVDMMPIPLRAMAACLLPAAATLPAPPSPSSPPSGAAQSAPKAAAGLAAPVAAGLLQVSGEGKRGGEKEEAGSPEELPGNPGLFTGGP